MVCGVSKSLVGSSNDMVGWCNPTYSILIERHKSYGGPLQWPLAAASLEMPVPTDLDEFSENPPFSFFRQIYNMTNYYQILPNWWPNCTGQYWDNTETVPRQYCNSNETVPRQHCNCSTTVLTDQWDSAVTSLQQYWDSTETVPWQYWDSTLTLLRQWPLTVAPCHSMAWAPKARRPR